MPWLDDPYFNPPPPPEDVPQCGRCGGTDVVVELTSQGPLCGPCVDSGTDILALVVERAFERAS